ncbi:MAG: hypothetical protein QXH51_06170 [Candidatus Bathyarchaeia archaeon]
MELYQKISSKRGKGVKIEYPQLKKEEIRALEECECPACRESGIEGLRESFTLRAIHNAWVYQKEIEKARKLVKNGEYKEYIEKIIRKTVLRRVLDTIDIYKRGNTLDHFYL